MTVPTTTPSDRELFEFLARLHGHRCPMSILGARLGMAARQRLEGARPEGSHLSARYFHATCALDGIQLVTGCTLGNGNIHAEPKGEHRLVLWVQETREQVVAELSDEALEVGRAYGDLRRSLQALRGGVEERQELERQMEVLLVGLETAPESELVRFPDRKR